MSVALLAVIAACLLFGAAAVLSRIAVVAGLILVVVAIVLAIYPLMQGLLWATGNKVTAMTVVIIAFALFCIFYYGRSDASRPEEWPDEGEMDPWEKRYWELRSKPAKKRDSK